MHREELHEAARSAEVQRTCLVSSVGVRDTKHSEARVELDVQVGVRLIGSAGARRPPEMS
jgi:hypothetical protein